MNNFDPAIETEKIIGFLKKTFEETLSIYNDDESPLFERKVDMQKIENMIESKRRI